MSCMLTLEEIEIKRQELERHLEDVMSVELSKWQSENKLCVSDVNASCHYRYVRVKHVEQYADS